MTSAAAVATTFDLGPIDQIAFAVKDVYASLPAYEAMFGGPFTVRDVVWTPAEVTYRGAPADAELRLGMGQTAGLEIELVEVLRGAGPSLEHLDAHGEGLHHVRFQVSDIETKLAELVDADFEVILDGRTSSGSRFAYLQTPPSFGHTVFELLMRPKAG